MNIHKLMNIFWCFEAFTKDYKYAARSDIFSHVKFSKLMPKCLNTHLFNYL